ncbi:MAG: hypothetical protein AAF415_04915 [Pseudomonadota bacterium]
MVERISALAGQQIPHSFGTNLTLSERRVAHIWQLTAWPDRLPDLAKIAAKAAGVKKAPGPLQSAFGTASLLRTEPLRWLMVSETELEPLALGAAGTLLDLSHARTVIRIEGIEMPALMARQVPLDLRPSAFPDGSVATTSLDHVAVTLHGREGGIDLYCMRSFGLAVWEHLIESAGQFALG